MTWNDVNLLYTIYIEWSFTLLLASNTFDTVVYVKLAWELIFVNLLFCSYSCSHCCLCETCLWTCICELAFFVHIHVPTVVYVKLAWKLAFVNLPFLFIFMLPLLSMWNLLVNLYLRTYFFCTFSCHYCCQCEICMWTCIWKKIIIVPAGPTDKY